MVVEQALKELEREFDKIVKKHCLSPPLRAVVATGLASRAAVSVCEFLGDKDRLEKDEVYTKTRSILSSVLTCPESDIEPTTLLKRDLGVDADDLAKFAMRFQEEAEVNAPVSLFQGALTFLGLVDCVRACFKNAHLHYRFSQKKWPAVKKQKPEPQLPDSYKQRVLKVIGENLGIQCESIKPEDRIVTNLGADSIDLIELVMAFEAEFECEVSDEEAVRCISVQDVYNLVYERWQKGQAR